MEGSLGFRGSLGSPGALETGGPAFAVHRAGYPHRVPAVCASLVLKADGVLGPSLETPNPLLGLLHLDPYFATPPAYGRWSSKLYRAKISMLERPTELISSEYKYKVAEVSWRHQRKKITSALFSA